MNSIIIYYSRSGNTEKIAKRLQSDLKNIPAIKIEPEEAYGNYIKSCIQRLFRICTSTTRFSSDFPYGHRIFLNSFKILSDNVIPKERRLFLSLLME